MTPLEQWIMYNLFSISPPERRETAADLFLDSVVASRNLLDAVADRKPMRIVLVSSFGVYGVAGLGRGTRVNEQTMLEPHPEWRDHYSYAQTAARTAFSGNTSSVMVSN